MEKLTLNELMELMTICYLDMNRNPAKDHNALISKIARIYMQEEELKKEA